MFKKLLVYKLLNGLAPDYLCSKFVDRVSVSNYSLRNIEGKTPWVILREQANRYVSLDGFALSRLN